MGRPGKSKRKQKKLKSKQESSSTNNGNAASELHPVETKLEKPQEYSKPTSGTKKHTKH